MLKRQRVISGVLALMIGCSAIMNPGITASAAETAKPNVQTAPQAEEEGQPAAVDDLLYDEGASDLPTFSEMRDRLLEKEFVIADDITIETGADFDISSDYRDIAFSEDKVRVVFKSAVKETLEHFQPDQPGTYQAVYEVYPVRDENLAYQVHRMVTIKSKEPETQSGENKKNQEEEADSDEDAGESSPEEGDQDSKEDTIQTAPESDDQTPDKNGEPGQDAGRKEGKEDTGLTKEHEPEEDVPVSDEETELVALDAEENLFVSVVPVRMSMQRSAEVTLVKGKNLKYPSNLGNYETDYFYVNGKIAYCLESAKGTPPDAGYVAEVLDSNANLQKVLYYGYGGPGDLTDQFMPQFDADTKYVFTHIAASYTYAGIEGFHGCTMEDLQATGVMGYIDYLLSQENPPVAALSLNTDHENAYLDGESQRTDIFELRGDHRNYIVLDIPARVTYHNTSNGDRQTGGTVNIYGGDQFYFTAPKDMSGEWTTKNMKGQLGAQWKTLVLSTGSTTQDIGYGDFIEEGASSVRFTVKWLDMSRITVKKKDQDTNADLSGAVFGVYSDAGCTDLIKTMPATDEKGSASVELEGAPDTVYLKELTAPAGYCLSTETCNVRLVRGGNTDITVKNKEQKGKIRISKEGERLSSAEAGETAEFIYNDSAFSGTTYSIYAAEDIKSQDQKTVIYPEDTLVETLETEANGEAVSQELHLGTYRVVERKAPDDLTIGKTDAETTREVTLEYAGQEAVLAQAEADYRNERPKVNVKAVKKSWNDDALLSGAEFGLYAGDDIQVDGNTVFPKDTLIQSAISGSGGAAVFTADIPINHKYYIREIQAPEKYCGSDERFEFTYSYKDGNTYEYEFSHEFQDEEVRAEIHIEKIDRETEQFLSQGDAVLAGAEYGLFAAENIEHPNQKSGTLYQKNDLVDKGRISEEGTLDFTDLYLGKYFVKELEPAAGYLLDETEYPVDASYEGQDVKLVSRQMTVKETVKKQAFQLIKTGSDGEQTEADLLQGAGFRVYLIRSLEGVKDGSIKPDDSGRYLAEQFREYDFSEETTALDYSEDSEGVPMPEFFTDEKGYACSGELAYGEYVVIESTVPENYSPIDPFLVTIHEDSREPQQWRIFTDYEFGAKLKIYKIDSASKRPILHGGAAFRIYDIGKEEYVKQYIHYPETKELTEFVTSDDGYLMTPEKLKAGRYRLEEVLAPEGYVKGGPLEFTIDSDTPYEIEGETGAAVIKLEYENDRQTGTLRLLKKGERLSGYGESPKNILQRFGEFLGVLKEDETGPEFFYEEQCVEGAEFAVFAAEDIKSPDHQCDENGNQILLYKKDELVSKLKTDQEGKAELSGLPLGSYKISETAAGEGFILSEEEQEFTLEYGGDEAEIVYHDSTFVNKRQKASLRIMKQDAETKEPVAGTLFGLYAAEDILSADGAVLVPADTWIETAVSDEEGLVCFVKDLPIAHYYAKEEQAAPGYILNGEPVDFDLKNSSQEEEVLTVTAEVTNDFTKVDISKVDIGGKDVIGAKLTIRDSEGNEAASWTTDGMPHRIDRLEPGDYVLIEEQAPDGYLIAEEVPFTVLDTGEIQKVEMVDEYEKTGTISVEKVGDMLTGTTSYDSDFGKINRMEYEKRPLPGVEFTIYDENGEAVEVITTTEEGRAVSKKLPLGKYILKETKTPSGLAMNYEEYEAVLIEDKEDAVVDVSLDIENDVIDTEINVYKVGEMLNPGDGTFGYGKKPLEGVYFGIYTDEEIRNYRNESVLPADSLIGVIKTNKEGKATLKAALVSGHYYYKELQTLEGYVLDEEKHGFELTLENEPLTVFEVNKENPALNMLMKANVKLVKIDANEENKKLAGAEFELFMTSGEQIGTYATDFNGEINMKDLGYGEYYFQEKKAPDGYQKLADNIEFSMKGEDITITCRNHRIPDTKVPKLGFHESTAKLALIFVAAGMTVLGIGFAVYRKKRSSRKDKWIG